MKKAWLNSDQVKQKGVYRHRWAGESRDQRTHDFMDEVKIALDWTTGEGLQSVVTSFCRQGGKAERA